MTRRVKPVLYFDLLKLLLFTGTTDSVRGPTLLDLRDLVGANTSDMSYTFVVAALGGLLGCFAGKNKMFRKISHN